MMFSWVRVDSLSDREGFDRAVAESVGGRGRGGRGGGVGLAHKRVTLTGAAENSGQVLDETAGRQREGAHRQRSSKRRFSPLANRLIEPNVPKLGSRNL